MIAEEPHDAQALGSLTLNNGLGHFLNAYGSEGAGLCAGADGSGFSRGGRELPRHSVHYPLGDALATVYAGEPSLGALDAVVQRLNPTC